MVSQIPHILEIKKTILSIEPELRKVFIFGSRAKEKQPDGHSDIGKLKPDSIFPSISVNAKNM